MNKFKIKQRVVITGYPKTNGMCNKGTIVGIEFLQDGHYLGYKSEKEYIERHKIVKYKIAYVDCVTKHACTEWFYEKDLQVYRLYMSIKKEKEQ